MPSARIHTPGKTLNNFSSSGIFASFMIQETLTHRFPSTRMGLETILSEKKAGKVKAATCSLISKVYVPSGRNDLALLKPQI